MPNTLNVDYLSSEELRFEINSRSAVPEGDLRAQLRELLRSSVEPKWNEAKFELDQEKEKVLQKLEDWEGVLEEIKACPPSGGDKSRKRSKLLHLLNRLKLLAVQSGLGVEDKVKIQEGVESTQALLTELQSTSRAKIDRSTSVASGDPSSSVVANNKDEVIPGSLQGSTMAQVSAPMELNNQVNLPTIPVSSPSGSQSNPAQATGSSASTVTTNVYGSYPMTTTSSMAQYHKLPNPLSPLLQNLPIVDGLDVEKLLKFLGMVFQTRGFPGINDHSLLQLIAPYCRGPLLDRLTSVIVRQGNLGLFHKEVMEFFIPDRYRERLKLERFYRPQGRRESLADYVASVKEAGRVLMVSMAEQEIVQTIVEGMNPEERSRLVFANRPTSFAELDKLCICSRSVQFADEQRGISSRMMSEGGDRHTMPVLSPDREPPRQNRWAGRVVTCYGCGEPGHIRRNCPKGEFNSVPRRNEPESKNEPGTGGGRTDQPR